jgi:Tol biopolymer transport system component
MTRHDAFEPDVRAWFDAEAQSPIPADALARTLALTAARRPWPRSVAGLGSHWTHSPSSRSQAGPLTITAGRSSWAVVLALMALVLVSLALIVGGRLVNPPQASGQLVYARDGDIYLADAAGRNPRRVADRGAGSDASFELMDGTIWAADGQHFLYYDSLTSLAHVSDADGVPVGAFPAPSQFAWSPDSSRIAVWPVEGPGVRTYRVDGAEYPPLLLPQGYIAYAQMPATWAPDGRSLYVPLAQPNVIAPPQVWQLMVDGSSPRPVSAGSVLAHGTPIFSRDGGQVALPGGISADADGVMHLANPDGSNLRPAISSEEARDPFLGSEGPPRWSPSGSHVAYLVPRTADPLTFDLVTVDTTAGTAATVMSDLRHDDVPSYGWSADGDEILFSMPDDGTPALWSVRRDGGQPTLIVRGARIGEWQPAGATSGSSPQANGDPSPMSATTGSLPSISPTSSVGPPAPSPGVSIAPARSFDPTRPVVPDTDLEYSVTLPPDWEHRAPGVIAGTGGRAGAEVRIGTVGFPNSELCGNAQVNATVHSTVEKFAQAVFAVVDGAATDPESVTIDGTDAKSLEFLAGIWICQPEGGLWKDSPNGVFWGDPDEGFGPAQGDTLWILDVEQQRVVIRITGSRYLQVDAVAAAAEQQRIVDSIHFEQRP